MRRVQCNSCSFDGFEPVLPSDLATYAQYRLDNFELFEARKRPIQDAISTVPSATNGS